MDLLVPFPEEISNAARDKTLKAICADVAQHLGCETELVFSKTGIKRDARYAYPSNFPSGALSEGVLLEMGCRGGTYPTATYDLRSLAALYAINELGEPPDGWAEFQPVPVSTLAAERTLLEKLALLHDAAQRFPTTKAVADLERGGRHLYDVHQLLESATVLASLDLIGSEGVEELSADIDRQSQKAGFSFTSRPDHDYGHSPLVAPTPELYGALRTGYARAMELVHGPRPSLDDCLTSIRRQAHRL